RASDLWRVMVMGASIGQKPGLVEVGDCQTIVTFCACSKAEKPANPDTAGGLLDAAQFGPHNRPESSLDRCRPSGPNQTSHYDQTFCHCRYHCCPVPR